MRPERPRPRGTAAVGKDVVGDAVLVDLPLDLRVAPLHAAQSLGPEQAHEFAPGRTQRQAARVDQLVVMAGIGRLGGMQHRMRRGIGKAGTGVELEGGLLHPMRR